MSGVGGGWVDGCKVGGGWLASILGSDWLGVMIKTDYQGLLHLSVPVSGQPETAGGNGDETHNQ